MASKNTAVVVIVVILIALGAWYFIGGQRAEDAGSVSSGVIGGEHRMAVEDAVIAFGKKMKNVSLAASKTELAAQLDREYAGHVAPELIQAWKSVPPSALGRQASNPYPESINVVEATENENGTYTVEANVIEVTSAFPKEAAGVYPVTLKLEERDGKWLIVSAIKGAYSTLPQRVELTGRQTCLEHRDKTGPQTLECAIGFKTDDGRSYALRIELMSSTDAAAIIQSGKRVHVQGVITPADQLSTNMWQKYDMEGILSVTSATAI